MLEDEISVAILSCHTDFCISHVDYSHLMNILYMKVRPITFNINMLQ